MPRYLFDRFCFDSEQRALLRGGEPVHLTPRAFRLLEMLLTQRPKAVSKRNLLDHIWAESIVEEANLKTLVNEIRNALEERGGHAGVIRTVYGYGYAFAGEVDEQEGEERTKQHALVSVQWGERSVLLPEGAHLIGRRIDCAVAIEDPSVSRVHARLEVSRAAIRIEDLRSKNGTFVRGARITGKAELLPRTELRIGQVDVRVTRLDTGEASTETVGR